jgi:hypothetical protein
MHKSHSHSVRVQRISDDPNRLFTWEVCSRDGAVVLVRSTKAFESRFDALLDSARFAAPLAFDFDVPG